jgi:hypothetical protein
MPVSEPSIPSLYLYSEDGLVIYKLLDLSKENSPAIIRRSTASTSPSHADASYDYPGLSRQHAEVWAREGKVAYDNLSLNCPQPIAYFYPYPDIYTRP